MNNVLHPVAILVIFLGTINLLRMASFLIGADFYGLLHHLKSRRKLPPSHPKFSVIIPAYNEELTILSCLASVLKSDYPKDKLEVVVVNDGSTDKTAALVEKFQKDHQFPNLRLITQSNSGKARALNTGMKLFAHGELVMCLDADSLLSPDAIKNAVRHFEDKKLVALAANVKIIPQKGLLNLIQHFEYLVSYQMKKAQTTYNIEYIIGGIGSTFRQSILKQVDYYDEDTVTEDIDLTMKILRLGNKNIRVAYASDVIAHTQSVLTLPDLIKQRYRWKWGRCQTFLKNATLFFSRNDQHTKGLTWLYLPYAIFSDGAFLLEPVIVSYILFVTLWYREPFTLISALAVITFYLVMNILSEDTLKTSDKLKLIVIAPSMYFLFYVLSFVEYVALTKSLTNLPNLNKSLADKESRWKPVTRFGYLPTP